MRRGVELAKGSLLLLFSFITLTALMSNRVTHSNSFFFIVPINLICIVPIACPMSSKQHHHRRYYPRTQPFLVSA